MDRNNIDKKYQWDLTKIYSSIDEYNKDLENLGLLVQEFIGYEGKITKDDKTLLEVLKLPKLMFFILAHN